MEKCASVGFKPLMPGMQFYTYFVSKVVSVQDFVPDLKVGWFMPNPEVGRFMPNRKVDRFIPNSKVKRFVPVIIDDTVLLFYNKEEYRSLENIN